MTKHTSKIQDLCLVGLFTAVIAILAQLSIPMPLGVPMTMQTFAITLAAIILGAKKGALATIIYMLIGAIGLPVFANFSGGWQIIIGPTGGFILSFPLMAYIIGLGMECSQKWLATFTGVALNLLCGTLMFCLIMKSSFLVGFTVCCLPFIPTTILQAILGVTLGTKIKKRLWRISYVN